MRKSLLLTGSIVLALAVFLVSSVSVSAQDKGIKLRFADYEPPASPISKNNAEWAKEVEKRTNGRVKISYFPGNTLTAPPQTYDSVVKSVIDVGHTLAAYSPGRLPLSEVTNLPLGFKDGYQATMCANEWYAKTKPKEYDDVKVMFMHSHGCTRLGLKKVISSMDEVKGLRIACNAQTASILIALGAAPVTMAISETYDAVQKGLADGFLLGVLGMQNFKFADVVKCSVENRAFSMSPILLTVMNKEKWSSISKEDQVIIEKINDEWKESTGKLWDQLNAAAIEYSKGRGVKFVKISDAEVAESAKKLQPVVVKWVADMKAKGLPADEAVKFCQDYIKAHP
jgi:TRAP-type C4-dicarboxylate transport system substrate-binding protein